MVQYVMPAKQPGYQIRVGWDNPLMTFFGQVVKIPDDPEEDEDVTLWIGTSQRECLTVKDLVDRLALFGCVSDDVQKMLYRDRVSALDRGPTRLQRQMSALLPPVPAYDGFAVGYHVFAYDPADGWFHHFAAPSKGEADDEADGLRKEGYPVEIISGPINIDLTISEMNERKKQ